MKSSKTAVVSETNFVALRKKISNSEKKLGRPKRLSEEKAEELRTLSLSSNYSLRELARMFNVSRMTVWRILYAM